MAKSKPTTEIGKNTNNKKSIKMRPSNPTSTALHPPYFQMISEAITTMKNRKGSSQQAISKFMQEKYGSALPITYPKILSVQLRRLAKEGKLLKVKSSYKIAVATTTTTTTTKTSTRKTVEKKEKIMAKTKRLSQVKTPEGKKKTTKAVSKVKMEKLKRLSQVKTPEVLKKRTNKGSMR